LVLFLFTSEGLVQDSNQDCQPNHNEQALMIALNAVGLPQFYLDNFQATSEWQGFVDAAPILPRENKQIVKYDFEASMFEKADIPAFFINGTEIPQSLEEPSKTVADSTQNSSLIAIEGAANFAMITVNGRFIEKKLEFIPDQGY